MSYPKKPPGDGAHMYEKDRAHRMAKKLGLHIVSRARNPHDEQAEPMPEIFAGQEVQRTRWNGPRLISTSSFSITEEGAS